MPASETWDQAHETVQTTLARLRAVLEPETARRRKELDGLIEELGAIIAVCETVRKTFAPPLTKEDRDLLEDAHKKTSDSFALILRELKGKKT